eukprot:jgi/Botrbrau1/21917/Bobra.0249s0043.1
MPRVGQPQARRGVQVQLSASLIELIQDRGLKTGESFDDIVNAALEVYLDGPNTSRRRASLSGRQPVNAVHITAPIITLVEGILRGETTIGEALRYGDFGLGTLNDLDGEVVVFKGTAYQQAADGSSRVLESTENTPFMTMTFLEEEPASVWECPIPSTDEHWDFQALQMHLEEKLTSLNLFHAILIKGHFPYLKARAVRKQAQQRGLLEVTRDQAVFEFHNEEGFLIGFFSPHYVGAAIAVPGFHLHFLSEDRSRGGHVLDCTLSKGSVLLHPLYRAEADMPHSAAFLQADFSRDPLEDIKEAETGS